MTAHGFEIVNMAIPESADKRPGEILQIIQVYPFYMIQGSKGQVFHVYIP